MLTKSQFHRYEAVRQSGVTNMLDLECVADLSGLDADQIDEVMSNYGAYCKAFGTDVDESEVERIKELFE